MPRVVRNQEERRKILELGLRVIDAHQGLLPTVGFPPRINSYRAKLDYVRGVHNTIAWLEGHREAPLFELSEYFIKKPVSELLPDNVAKNPNDGKQVIIEGIHKNRDIGGFNVYWRYIGDNQTSGCISCPGDAVFEVLEENKR